VLGVQRSVADWVPDTSAALSRSNSAPIDTGERHAHQCKSSRVARDRNPRLHRLSTAPRAQDGVEMMPKKKSVRAKRKVASVGPQNGPRTDQVHLAFETCRARREAKDARNARVANEMGALAQELKASQGADARWMVACPCGQTTHLTKEGHVTVSELKPGHVCDSVNVIQRLVKVITRRR
jgi:hypothetical protein